MNGMLYIVMLRLLRYRPGEAGIEVAIRDNRRTFYPGFTLAHFTQMSYDECSNGVMI
jgi:hypothetical protein